MCHEPQPPPAPLQPQPHPQLRSATPLPQGTGMAIYFPATRVAYSEWYTRFADTPAFQPAVNDWDDFLKALYNLGESISSNYNSEASVLA